MPRKVDPEVLAGFIEEAKSYLPKILQGIAAFHLHPNRGESLEEAYRHAHTIKGAASMVGLNGLSTMANQLEEALEELMTARNLPPVDETVVLLQRIVAHVGLYLEGKASGSLREKPLIEEVNRAFDELRSLPSEHHVASAPDEDPSPHAEFESDLDPFVIRLDDLRGWLKLATLGTAADMASVRQPFSALQAEAFRLGRVGLSDALQRLCAMTEVWECLTAEGGDSAREVAAFCDRALDDLARCARDSEAEEDTNWIILESTDRWGEYLALLEPVSFESDDDLEMPALDGSGGDESSPAIDACDLLRLLTGESQASPAPEPERSSRITPPRRSPAREGAQPPEEPDDSLTREEVSADLREVFALEAEDHLRDLSTLLPALERHPENRVLLQDIRRSAHTLKGSAAMVGFRSITQLAHRMEDLLDLLFECKWAVTPAIIRLLFASVDALEDLVNGKSRSAALRDLYANYDQLLGARPGAEAAEPAAAEEMPASPAPEAPALARPAARAAAPARAEPVPEPAQAAASLTPDGAGSADPRRRNLFVRFPIERLDELVKLLGELVITRTFLEQRMADLTRQVAELEHSSDRLRRVAARLETQFEASALSAGRLSPMSTSDNGNGHHHPITTQTHGFDDLEFDRYTEFHLLTRSLAETTSDIQTVAGELGSLSGDFDSFLNRQACLSSEVEDKLMRSRMVPLATLASRLHRTVRNVANQQGKLVDLVLEGERTELDKTVLEEMADPLLHLLRNSVDHGIESPEARAALGKPARGAIRLRADYVGSQVVIQISDDGAGLDPELIRYTAVSRGFIAASDTTKMSDAELLSLVYLPGFSTVQQISEVSGRGVGLDIVKANVHKLKGSIALESQVGKGTTFTIHLPMTMAIIRAILVKTHQETFAIPLSAVRQIVRLDRDKMEWVGQDPVVRVGGQVHPVFSLGKVLNLKQPADDSLSRRPVLMLDVGVKQAAIVVDHLIGGREIVIKNLGNHLRRVPNLMGATLMGDGTVVLILDPVELVREAAESKTPKRLSLPTPAPIARDTWSILIVDDSPSVRRVLSNLIKNAGWKPITAKDGLEALEILHHSASTPNLVLLDVEMPRMDGYELLATLKAHEAYQQIPVVMVTSRAGDKHRRKALDLGGSAYVVKPYQDEVLLNVVRHLVRETKSKQVQYT